MDPLRMKHTSGESKCGLHGAFINHCKAELDYEFMVANAMPYGYFYDKEARLHILPKPKSVAGKIPEDVIKEITGVEEEISQLKVPACYPENAKDHKITETQVKALICILFTFIVISWYGFVPFGIVTCVTLFTFLCMVRIMGFHLTWRDTDLLLVKEV